MLDADHSAGAQPATGETDEGGDHRQSVRTAEDGLADTVRPRVDALEGDPAEITILQAVRDGDRERSFNLGRDIEALERVVAGTRPR